MQIYICIKIHKTRTTKNRNKEEIKKKSECDPKILATNCKSLKKKFLILLS